MLHAPSFPLLKQQRKQGSTDQDLLPIKEAPIANRSIILFFFNKCQPVIKTLGFINSLFGRKENKKEKKKKKISKNLKILS